MDIDYIFPTAEQKSDIERLAALGYSIADMALYFDMDPKEFRHDAETEGCLVNYHIRRGKLIIKANAGMKLMELAENGNLTATQQLAKITAQMEYKDMLNQLSDDEI